MRHAVLRDAGGAQRRARDDRRNQGKINGYFRGQLILCGTIGLLLGGMRRDRHPRCLLLEARWQRSSRRCPSSARSWRHPGPC